MPNRLQHESSPYLLQHANNPVDWFPWGEEAFEKAIAEDKPVLVSIGYSACHWCHVMERESFESEETAALMNGQFINIKIDREERPDLDHIYMDAVQAMTGSGGWPLNVFLTPEKKPFYGGTYFPPTPVFNRPSWTDVLSGISANFREKREEVEQQASYLTAHIEKNNDFGIGSGAGIFNKEQAELMFNNIMKTADRQEGGFGQAPKFPQTFTIRFLLHYYYHTKDGAALDQAILSLEKMIDGGINDHLGGGFARYSTDASWLAPHFEKMLYDNALLVTAMSEAYQITQSPKLLSAITKTIEFVFRELTDSNHGMYAALDADSEGVEGKFYTWSRAEIEMVLGEDTDLFCEYYGVTVAGNWEHTNILHLPSREISLATAFNMDAADLELFIANCREKLIKQREKRVRPQLDDKIILGWNALMVIALCKASAATGNLEWRSRAVANMNFLLSKFRQPDGSFAHTFKNNISKYPAFLDDYAYLISALIHLQEVTADPEWLNIAKSLTNFVCTKFGDNGPLFHFTAVDQKDVIIRKKEIYDGAVPSGNAVMMWNLYQLGIIFDIAAWRSRASEMAGATAEAAVKFPGSFGIWAGFILSMAYGIPEIAITGEESTDLSNEFLRNFIGYNVFQSATLSNEDFPLLAGKPNGRKAMLFLCQNYACQAPVETVADLLELLNET